MEDLRGDGNIGETHGWSRAERQRRSADTTGTGEDNRRLSAPAPRPRLRPRAQAPEYPAGIYSVDWTSVAGVRVTTSRARTRHGDAEMRWATSGAEFENGDGKPVHPLPGGVRKPCWVTDMLTFVG